jgi:hypothetical protein
MSVSLEDKVAGLGAGSATPAVPASTANVKPLSSDEGPLIVVPAGFVGDIVGSLAGTIGEVTGGWFGNKNLGKTLGQAAGR